MNFSRAQNVTSGMRQAGTHSRNGSENADKRERNEKMIQIVTCKLIIQRMQRAIPEVCIKCSSSSGSSRALVRDDNEAHTNSAAGRLQRQKLAMVYALFMQKFK